MRLTDIKGAAEYLDLRVGWLYQLTHTFAIPYLKLGRKVRFDLDECDLWVLRGGTAKTARRIMQERQAKTERE